MNENSSWTILDGDCLERMQETDANSVHAVVTDPPYGLAFMGKSWDQFEPNEYQAWCEQWATECVRVLKPGGHLIAFSGNRTHHRLFSGVEDAGFEIRDSLTWLHGQGFPKAHDISKHIDRYYDAEDEREVVDSREETSGWKAQQRKNEELGFRPNKYHNKKPDVIETTVPATSEAERWSGYRTALKPAVEFAVLARAPMSEDAIYKNVMKHGCGALNVDRTRVPTDGKERPNRDRSDAETGNIEKYGTYQQGTSRANGTTTQGRYPANLLLDPIAARMLDEQSGDVSGGDERGDCHGTRSGGFVDVGSASGSNEPNARVYSDVGGPSRYFKTVEPTRFKYTSKASKRERSINGQLDNSHPTVKPLDLMEWLVTLVTAPGQRVLDPFAGSGTTIMACKRLGREGVGIEQDRNHAELARKRVGLAFDESLETAVNCESNGETEIEHNTKQEQVDLESYGDD